MTRVIARITDGLGNQLFQYATGFAAARRAGVPLDLDVTWYARTPPGIKPRKLRLLEVVGEQGHRHVLHYGLPQKVANLMVAFLRGSNRREFQFFLPAEVFPAGAVFNDRHLNRPCYIAGYPFDIRLFEDVVPEIRALAASHLRARNPLGKDAERYAFVHVRRDDLAKDPRFSQAIGVLPEAYYHDAMRLYEAKFGKTEWLVCSDDVDEAMSILPRGFSICPSPAISEVEDLAIMAAAAGGVIANSTFSFWGALLSASEDARFVAPARWRRDEQAGIPVPEKWLQLGGVAK